MAKYMIRESTYVGEGPQAVYHQASFSDAKIITVPNSIEPSRKWVPMDQAAVDALKRLGVDRKINEGINLEPPPSADSTPDTNYEAQTRPAKAQTHGVTARAADRH